LEFLRSIMWQLPDRNMARFRTSCRPYVRFRLPMAEWEAADPVVVEADVAAAVVAAEADVGAVAAGAGATELARTLTDRSLSTRFKW
jgi:hypothetical protein